MLNFVTSKSNNQLQKDEIMKEFNNIAIFKAIDPETGDYCPSYFIAFGKFAQAWKISPLWKELEGSEKDAVIDIFNQYVSDNDSYVRYIETINNNQRPAEVFESPRDYKEPKDYSFTKNGITYKIISYGGEFKIEARDENGDLIFIDQQPAEATFTLDNTRVVKRIFDDRSDVYYAIPASKVKRQSLAWTPFADGSVMDEEASMDYSFKASDSNFLEDMVAKAGYDYDELCEDIEFQASYENEKCYANLLPGSEMKGKEFRKIIIDINNAAEGQSRITMVDAATWFDGEKSVGIVIDWEGSNFYSVDDAKAQDILNALNKAKQPISDEKVDGYRIVKSNWCPKAIAAIL